MSAISRLCRGQHLFSRQADAVRWYPTPTSPAAYVEVWAVDTDAPIDFEHAKFVGRFAPNQKDVSIDFNPAQDRYKQLRAVSYSAAGVPSVRYLDDAPAITVLFNRLTAACTLSQVGAATETSVQIQVTDFDTTLVVARQVQVSTVNTFATTLIDAVDVGAAAIAPSIFVYGNPSDVIYVRVRHSSHGSGGPWSAWSAVLSATFANPGGGGGSPGGGGGYGRDPYEY